jgi:hypothetical protein
MRQAGVIDEDVERFDAQPLAVCVAMYLLIRASSPAR